MTQQEINILNFEYELGITRQRLNNLIYESNFPNDENAGKIMQSKIDLMTNELHHMETQLQLLKDSMETVMTETVSPSVLPEKQPMPQAKSPEQPVIQPAAQPVPQPATPPALEPKTPVAPVQQKSSSLEDIFGRNLMGIFASVLIFIGMILFGMIIIPKLSEETKIFCMYFASFSATAAGIAFMKKSPTNIFFISLSGLGTGGLFVSLIMSNVYFHLFSDLLTYILLLCWAIGTIVLSKFEKSLSDTESSINVFEIIGQLGVLISVILGCTLCGQEKDFVKFLMLVVYYLIAMTAFHCGNAKLSRGEYGQSVFVTEYKVQNHVFNILTIFILVVSYLSYIITPGSFHITMPAEGGGITLFLALTIAEDLFIAYKEEKISESACVLYHLFMNIYALTGILLILQFGIPNAPKALLSYALCAGLLLLVELWQNEYNILAQLPLFLIALASLMYTEATAGILYLLFGTILLLFIGVRKSSNIYLITGTLSLYAWTFFYLLLYTVTLKTVIALTICTGVYLYILNKTKEKTLMLSGYPAVLVAVTVVFSTFLTDMKNLLVQKELLSEIEHFRIIIAFSIAGVFHICMTMRKNFQKEEIKAMAVIITIILMLVGCRAISYCEIPLLPIVIAIGIFTLNSKELLAKEELKNSSNNRKYWIMAYILLKYTILLTVILNSFQTPGFLISIALLIFAVLSIIIGFVKRKKGYRLYGLALCMISIFKLIMLDLNTNDTVTGSFSFIICGLLCLFISFLYNKIQKEYFDDM